MYPTLRSSKAQAAAATEAHGESKRKQDINVHMDTEIHGIRDLKQGKRKAHRGDITKGKAQNELQTYKAQDGEQQTPTVYHTNTLTRNSWGHALHMVHMCVTYTQTAHA